MKSEDINIRFARTLLRLALADVNPLTTVAERKAVWVYDFGRDHWEFHGPNGYYWHGSADNAYAARAQGWSHWLEHLKRDAAAMRARLEAQRQRAVRR